MPPDDARLEDARAWLARAELDLRAADLEMGTPEAGLWGDVAFHAQQAAEKALKAFLALHDEPFRKTYSIEELGGRAPPSTRGSVSSSTRPRRSPSSPGSSAIRATSATLPAKRPGAPSRWRGSSSSP